MEKRQREKKIPVSEQLANANQHIAVLESSLRTKEGNHDFALENIKKLLDTIAGNCTKDHYSSSVYGRSSDTVNVKQKINDLIVSIAQENAGNMKALEIANSEIAWLRSIIGSQVGVMPDELIITHDKGLCN